MTDKPLDSIDNIGTTPDGRITMTVTGDPDAIRAAAEVVGMDVDVVDHDHDWERGRDMKEKFGVPGNVTVCVSCGVRKGEWEARQFVDDQLAAAGMPNPTDADMVAAAGADIPDANVTALAIKGKAPKVLEPGRVLVTMHYPLRMDVVSGIMRLVDRWYPGSVVGEDGTIREKGKPVEVPATE